jgi:signal peptidase
VCSFYSFNKILFKFINLRDNGYVKFLTKGDNNKVDDRGLYSPGQLWLEQKDVIGRARG